MLICTTCKFISDEKGMMLEHHASRCPKCGAVNIREIEITEEAAKQFNSLQLEADKLLKA